MVLISSAKVQLLFDMHKFSSCMSLVFEKLKYAENQQLTN